MHETEERLWYREPTLEDLRELVRGNMLEHLGIQFTEIGPNYLTGRMPVDSRTLQPYGILHGGASVVLAETLASVAANLRVNPATSTCVGLDLSSNHVRRVTEGIVTGTTRPVHLGGRTQVWDVTITNEAGKLVNTTRITLLVLDRPQVRAPSPSPDNRTISPR